MAIYNPTFILGILILLYLSSFVLFALLRIATGISIQRVGYFSLRRIAYTPKDGVKIEIRSLGLLLHRPTFAQPTWLSLVFEELQVTVDLKVLGGHGGDVQPKQNGDRVHGKEPGSAPSSAQTDQKHRRAKFRPEARRSQTWEHLTTLKEEIKRVHRKIHWLRLLDVVATNTSFTIMDVGQLQVGSFTMAVDIRPKVIGRTRLFRHITQSPSKDQCPAEWMFTVRAAFFKPDEKESVQVLDTCSLNIHGRLYQNLNGLRDATIALKFGRVHIPYDDIMACAEGIQQHRSAYGREDGDSPETELSLMEVMEELNMPGTREKHIMQTVADSKEFVSSILRGIKEVQFGVSFIRLSTEIRNMPLSGGRVYLNTSMKEIAIDLHRLNPKSPAHQMYFSPADISHEALVAAMGLSVDLDSGHQVPERLAHVPMTTATVKTTLPSKTFQATEERSVADRNANILFANMVVTSPSLDLDPKHLPFLLALVRPRPYTSQEVSRHRNHHLISRLLPKASVKLAVHEPVIRVSLPPMELDRKTPDDYDLLISSNSYISVELESFHSAVGELHYSLACNLRVRSQQFYYQTARGARYDLLMTETVELKVRVSADPAICVLASGNIQTFSVHMVRPEISEGVRQIVKQLKSNTVADESEDYSVSQEHSFLREIPPWLLQFDLRGSNFSVEVAGVDEEISAKTRGVAFQLDSWTVEYRQQKIESARDSSPRRRTPSRSLKPEDARLDIPRPSSARTKQQNPTDGRRLTMHFYELDGFVVDSMSVWESQPFLSLPRFEVALSSSRDPQGPIFHVHSFIRTLFLEYNLYRYYAIGVAATVLKKIFATRGYGGVEVPKDRHHHVQQHRISLRILEDQDLQKSPLPTPELVTIDLKASLIQIKASLPSDPEMMLQIHSLDLGKHRWTPQSFKGKLLRLFVRAPRLPGIWARITCIKNPRLDFRDVKKKVGSEVSHESSIDFSADAMRLAVPHQLTPHKIFDNFANVLKATTQLQHRFATGSNEYVLGKGPEGPKKIPKISLRTRAFLFELEDGPFEWKLSAIYRVGLIEQKQRLARAEAFEAKVQKLKEMEQRRISARVGGRGLNRRKTSRNGLSSECNGEDDAQHLPAVQSAEGYREFRYDRHGKCGLSDNAKVSVEQARTKLLELNAQSWKKRIEWALAFQRNAMKGIRGVFWEADELPDGVEETETILEYPRRPALMAAMISDLKVLVDKPSFPLSSYPEFLHRVGKGMPYDMEYSLLIPLHLQVEMGETRMTLRDYPLPLLHIPLIRQSQSPRTPSWSISTDFVIAEEYRDSESTRHVKVVVVPPEKAASEVHHGGFAIDVRRTVSPVKTYSDVKIEINTAYATKLAWATSYQPAIQDMMMVIETFTKPQLDPSDRTGFWDKIRLSVHSRVNIIWTGDGEVHLMLKGSRDPYVVTGYGAGFVMCWRENVKWRVCQDEDPRKFMSVESGEYILAVPDYTHQARQGMETAGRDSDTLSITSSTKGGALFKKVIMKLTGNVQWLAGLMFERKTDIGGRSYDFVPHYDVVLKTPFFARAPKGEVYDAFRGFRSNYIHLSIAVIAPVDRDWSVSNLKPSNNYNSVHLTPRFFTHFFSWWSLFSGAMSLPVHQGSLWPGLEKTSKKFGRHIATIKYNLLLSPLFIGHIYKHKDAEDYKEDMVSATGLKIKLDSFMIDLHQRREELLTSLKGRKSSIKTSGMRINQAQLDFISADIRAVSASIAGTTAGDLKRASEETLASYQQPMSPVDMSRFTIPDNDFSWIDMDDFVELDWILPTKSNPETKIMPLAYAPRFTYFRQTDHQNLASEDTASLSTFGDEPTHFCVMSPDNDPRRIQCDLIRERIQTLEKQIDRHQRSTEEMELKVIRDVDQDELLRQQFHTLKQHGHILGKQKQYLHTMLQHLMVQLQASDSHDTRHVNQDQSNNSRDYLDSDRRSEQLEAVPLTEFANDFKNRFIVHNPQIKWNNSLRNIILRYIHQVSQRRGFVYYLSRRAVKFILDIVEEQNRSKQPVERPPGQAFAGLKSSAINAKDTDMSVEDRIEQLLRDAKKFVDADDPVNSEGTQVATTEDLGSNIANDFIPQNNYHVRLIAPQIQLQSEKNTSAAVLVTAKGMELKVVQIMDKDRMTDDVSGLVQRRFSADMNSVQIFVTDQKRFASKFLPMFSGKRYGTTGSAPWPPWVPLEVMFYFDIDPYGFSRVVQRTSASLRYDKYNTLRLKVNDEIDKDGAGHSSSPQNGENHVDRIWVEFPQIRSKCDSAQYYAIYLIVLDLLLYKEPLEKVRTERLERIMLASDFSDLRGAPEMVTRLQERISQLEEIKLRFQLNAKFLDRQGWEDRLAIEQDLAGCEDELFFMMKAITTSQRKFDDRSETSGLLRWYLSASQVVWHLMREKNEPLIEFQLENAAYDRIDNSDGSNHNTVHIDKIRGFNLLSDAVYPEMIAPYIDNGRSSVDSRDIKMLQVHWQMLEAIAGIPVMDHFEVNLFPLKVQLEREVGKKLFEYIFPGSESTASGSRNVSQLALKHSRLTEEGSKESIDPAGSLESSMHDDHEEQEPNGNIHGLMMRLKPTLTSSEHGLHTVPLSPRPRPSHAQHQHTPNGDHHSFRLFQPRHRSVSSSVTPSVGTPRTKMSAENLRMTALRPLERTSSNLSTLHSSINHDSSKRFSLRRSSTRDIHEDKDKRGSDELTQMMSRASNYMTLAYVKVPSVVLCLSYQGRGERNIEDLHNFVFRMPVLEYRNKTWSNLDLALHLKRDVIKALISHTGAIIGNKFSHHRPSKQQQSRLREMANTATLLTTGGDASNTSDSSSRRESSPGGGELSVSPTRHSFTSEAASTIPRTASYASSIWSSATKNSTFLPDAQSASALALADGAAATTNNHDDHGFIHNTLGRHLSHFSNKARHKDRVPDESDESNQRRKSKLLLGGKKLLPSLD